MADGIVNATGPHIGPAARKDGFSARKRLRFLDMLALTCNITAAAAFAGVDTTTAHRARARDEAFAAEWQEALSMGLERLRARLFEHVGAGERIEADPDRALASGADPAPFDFDRAMRLLSHYDRLEGRDPRRLGGRPLRNATREETNAALAKALAAMQRRLPPADRA